MLLDYKLCIGIYWLFVVVLSNLQAHAHNIKGPIDVKSLVGRNIVFMWNTTNQRGIRSAIFGLSNRGLAYPQFINVNTLSGRVHYNPKICKHYFGRVHFVGNLSIGHAWFVIKNLQLNDTNEYLARISIDADTVMSHVVRLTVRDEAYLERGVQVFALFNHFQDMNLTSTATTVSKWTKYWEKDNETHVQEPEPTTSKPSEHKNGPMLIIIVSVIFVLIITVVFTSLIIWKRRGRHEGKMLEQTSMNKEVTEKTPSDEDSQKTPLALLHTV